MFFQNEDMRQEVGHILWLYRGGIGPSTSDIRFICLCWKNLFFVPTAKEEKQRFSENYFI